jgi:4-amino-4-deoxy-L-arabinose transferase-like glycosyltransferase
MNKKYILFSLAIILLAFFLRFYKLQQISPYWEEVALGYDAYSILNTTKDHHGNFLPLAAFESFGDFKPSLYFYAAVPFIKLFGLNILSVRLASVISGILIVISVGLITYELTKNQKLTVLGLLIASISPWAIHFSRAAWEANLATVLICFGVLFGLKFIKNSKFVFLTFSSIFLSLSLYAYHSARLIAPMLGLAIFLTWVFKNKQKIKKQNFKFLILILVLNIIITFPLIRSFGSSEINHRFKETSIFSNQEIILKSNQAKELTNNSLVSKIFYHRYLLFSKQVLFNYFSHFNIDFLFVSGDINPRHNSQYFGLFYYLDFLFLILSIFYLSNKKTKKYNLIIFWLLISIIPASLTKTTPHALRILPAMPAFIISIILGINYLLNILKNKKIIIYFIFIVYLINFIAFYRHYLTVYPKAYSGEWQYGYQEMINKVNDLKKQNPDLLIFISRKMGRPAMYYWFYSQTNPTLVQEAEIKTLKDQGEFLEFQNIKFFTKTDEVDFKKGIIALTSNELGSNTNSNYQVLDPLGKTVWHILLIK